MPARTDGVAAFVQTAALGYSTRMGACHSRLTESHGGWASLTIKWPAPMCGAKRLCEENVPEGRREEV